jgi:hypothetical protein
MSLKRSHLDQLAEKLRLTPALTVELMSDVIAAACNRIPALDTAGRMARLHQMLNVGASVDAALALVELELPAWKLRRLICEDGHWYCSLSRTPNFPAEFDDIAEASHDVAALAILSAFLEARRIAPEERSSVPRVRPWSGRAMICENFA